MKSHKGLQHLQQQFMSPFKQSEPSPSSFALVPFSQNSLHPLSSPLPVVTLTQLLFHLQTSIALGVFAEESHLPLLASFPCFLTLSHLLSHSNTCICVCVCLFVFQCSNKQFYLYNNPNCATESGICYIAIASRERKESQVPRKWPNE